MAQFITNACACDWVTLGTWSENTMRLLAPASEGTAAKIRNYSGESTSGGNAGGSVFWGTGAQFVNGELKPHHMVQATGFLAQQMLVDVAELVAVADRWMKCTRIDVQITVPLLSQTKFTLAHLSAAFPPESGATIMGTGREVSLYPQGFGSASERYWRIYVKVDDDNTHYLRFEVMIRGKVSKETFKAVQKPAVDLARVWVGEQSRMLEKWPQLAEIEELGVALLLAQNQAQGGDYSAVVARSETNTYKWLMEVAIPSARRFVNSHDTPLDQRGDVLELLRRALWECTQ